MSIFGTLFERGLDPGKRSQLGAHYTDPATIERIVEPVLKRPLLQVWEQLVPVLQALLAKSTKKGDKNYKAAQVKFIGWLDQLKNFRVLDPACGNGNFLFMGLKALKDIEQRSALHPDHLLRNLPLSGRPDARRHRAPAHQNPPRRRNRTRGGGLYPSWASAQRPSPAPPSA